MNNFLLSASSQYRQLTKRYPSTAEFCAQNIINIVSVPLGRPGFFGCGCGQNDVLDLILPKHVVQM